MLLCFSYAPDCMLMAEAEISYQMQSNLGSPKSLLWIPVQVVQYYPNMVFVDPELVEVTSFTKNEE